MQLNFLPGLFALLAIPLLILIHSLGRRPVKKEVTSLFLWEAAIKEEKSAIYVDALLKNIALVLQILVIVLVALSLSEPAVLVEKAGGKKRIIIMDTSASMKTLTDEGNRFDTAREKARQLVSAMSDIDSAMVIDAGVRPAIVRGFTRDKGSLAGAIARMAPSDARSDLDKAIFLALSFVAQNRSSSRIYLVTDGAGADLNALAELYPGLTPLLVRGGDSNQAIVNFTLRPRPGTKAIWDLLVVLKNFSSRSKICPLTVRTGSRVVFEKNVGLTPGQGKTIVHAFDGRIGNYMTAAIRVNDDLACDNQAYAVLQQAAQTHVFLVSRGNYFLERLLSVLENVTITRAAQIPSGAFENIAANNHIVILDNVAPPGKIPGNFIVINASFPGIPIRLTGTVDAPWVMNWNQQSAITANIDFGGLYVRAAQQMILADPAAVPVLESKQTPLISQYYDRRTKAVMFGFDINDSDLPLRVAFPVLMKNIFHWMHPVNTRFAATHVSVGKAFDIHVPQDASTVAVRDPSGKWEKITRDRGLYPYADTGRAGLYKIRVNDHSAYRAVNLFDAAESNINAVPDMADKFGEANKAIGQEMSCQAVPLWPLTFLAGILVLIMETVLFLAKAQNQN